MIEAAEGVSVCRARAPPMSYSRVLRGGVSMMVAQIVFKSRQIARAQGRLRESGVKFRPYRFGYNVDWGQGLEECSALPCPQLVPRIRFSGSLRRKPR